MDMVEWKKQKEEGKGDGCRWEIGADENEKA